MSSICRECGQAFQPQERGRGYAAIFCSGPCKKDFNNRRAMRGAKLYDLFMILRFERGLAKARGIWALACELARLWRVEDKEKRGGRQSWQSYSELHDGLLPLRVVALGGGGAPAGRVACENSIAARSRAA